MPFLIRLILLILKFYQLRSILEYFSETLRKKILIQNVNPKGTVLLSLSKGINKI
nr:hypothetical protein [Mucilaginibacter sp. FT3.2]